MKTLYYKHNNIQTNSKHSKFSQLPDVVGQLSYIVVLQRMVRHILDRKTIRFLAMAFISLVGKWTHVLQQVVSSWWINSWATAPSQTSSQPCSFVHETLDYVDQQRLSKFSHKIAKIGIAVQVRYIQLFPIWSLHLSVYVFVGFIKLSVKNFLLVSRFVVTLSKYANILSTLSCGDTKFSISFILSS